MTQLTDQEFLKQAKTLVSGDGVEIKSARVDTDEEGVRRANITIKWRPGGGDYARYVKQYVFDSDLARPETGFVIEASEPEYADGVDEELSSLLQAYLGEGGRLTD